MKTPRVMLSVILTMLFSLLSAGAALADDDRSDDDRWGQTWSVTVTNLTRMQVITPPLLFSHNGEFKLFEIGEAVSEELAILAEEGDPDPLMALLDTHEAVFDVVRATDGIPYGQSMTLEVTTRGRYNRLSVAGMLATTNDAFFALRGIKVPYSGMKSRTAVAYDAGSEANTELCDHIPGPPCFNHVRMPDGAEGRVFVHNGIHGIGDLDEENMDWRNPVAHVTIKKHRR